MSSPARGSAVADLPALHSALARAARQVCSHRSNSACTWLQHATSVRIGHRTATTVGILPPPLEAAASAGAAALSSQRCSCGPRQHLASPLNTEAFVSGPDIA
eukprot:2345176-Rhodomonas_salina.2